MDDAPLMRKLARKTRCRDLEQTIQHEMYTMR